MKTLTRQRWWCDACACGGIDFRPQCWNCGSRDVHPVADLIVASRVRPDVGFQRSSP